MGPLLRTLPLAASAAAAWSALAQPVPRLDSVSATWFQRGTTNDVTLNGDALSGVTEVVFTGSGLSGTLGGRDSAAVTLEGSGGGLTAGRAGSAKSLALRLALSPEAPLGDRQIRVMGSDGVSNPLTLHISDLPEVAGGSSRNQASNAPMVTLPAAFSGVVGAPAESDFFRFKARAGERIILDVQANRFGSPLDPTLAVMDAGGKALAQSEDVHGLDPFLEFVPPADGDYVVQIHDMRFQGGGDYAYRVVAGVLPYLDQLFPLGGARGASVDVRFKGRNLEGAEALTLRVAADAPLGRQDLRARTTKASSNPLPFEVGDAPEILESENNNTRESANPVTPPMVVNGRMGEPKDVDFFRIKASADQKLVAEVHARSLGSPLDALLTLMDSGGAVLARNDDANGPDARLEFDAKKDAEYFLSLRDLTDRGGESFSYRLVVKAADTRPDFIVKASGGRFRVHRGGRTAIRCEADRRNGFDGALRVAGAGLPAGVDASVLVLGGSTGYGWLVVSAAADAPLGSSLLRLTAVGEQGGGLVEHGVQFPEQAWITVLPPAPFTVEAAQPAALTEQNRGATLDVSVFRRNGFTGEIKVRADAPSGVDAPVLTLGPGVSRGKLSLNPAYNAETGVRPVMVRAEAQLEGATVSESASAAVPLSVEPIAMFLTAMLPGSPFFRLDGVKLSAVALPTNSASSANATEFVVKVDRRGLTGEIALALEGLPAGVQATVNPIAANANEASVKLLVTDKAETGKDFKFNAVGTATYNDRIWRQKTQAITLLVAAPEKEASASTAQSSNAPAAAPVAAAK